MEDVAALGDARQAASFGEVRQADRALIALHRRFVVDCLKHSLETVNWLDRPAGDSFRDQDEHAADSDAHDRVHVEEIVHIRIGALKPGLDPGVDDELIGILGFEQRVGDGLSGEDGDEDGKEEGEGADHIVVEVIELEEEEQCEHEEDVDVE